MKNMKIIIALVLGATGSAALPIPKTVIARNQPQPLLADPRRPSRWIRS